VAAVNSTLLWYITRATGIVTLILLTGTMVLGLVTSSRVRTRQWPGFAVQEMHRRLSMMAVVFLAVHVVTSVLDTYVSITWISIVVPFTSPYAGFWVGVGAVSLDLMLAVFVSSLLRSRLSAGSWRALHWLAYLSWPVALAHTFGMGTDAGEPWVIALGCLCGAAVGGAFLWRVRHTRQIRARRPGPVAGRILALTPAPRGPRHGGF
jgi:DMSO/TMAO reductase YedYZ heme-binding membrane subunit